MRKKRKYGGEHLSIDNPLNRSTSIDRLPIIHYRRGNNCCSYSFRIHMLCSIIIIIMLLLLFFSALRLQIISLAKKKINK